MHNSTVEPSLIHMHVIQQLLDNQPLDTVLDYFLSALERVYPNWKCLFRGVDLAHGQLRVLRSPEGLSVTDRLTGTTMPCRHAAESENTDTQVHCERSIKDCPYCSGCYEMAENGFASCVSMPLQTVLAPDLAMLTIFVHPNCENSDVIMAEIDPWLPLLRLIWLHWVCHFQHGNGPDTLLPHRVRRIMSDEFLRCEQMASIGSMVAGIAHELSTPVGNAILTLDFLQDQLRVVDEKFAQQSLKRTDLHNFFKEVPFSFDLLAKNLQRTSTMVHSFKQVAVDQCSERVRPFSVRQVIEDNWAILRIAMRGKQIEFQLEMQPDDFMVESQPGALGQVITNLFNNAQTHAFEAMEKGQIRIEVGMQGLDRFVLKFSDNGCGIPDVQQQLIFNQFFTTKGDRGGSGLGLYLVHELVTRKLQGTIMVHSCVGSGTTFIMSFPCKLGVPITADESVFQ